VVLFLSKRINCRTSTTVACRSQWAACQCTLQVLALLLRRGADINARDEDEQTPLHYAALCEQVIE
jgi:ankyrin repeat protein